MKKVIAVTGPMRSGTSCVTGLLELCGFNLGRNIRVLRNPTSMNPKGHFELDLLFTVNHRLLTECGPGYDVFNPPQREKLLNQASRRKNYFNLFRKKFDGELCKDPLFCHTIGAWRQNWPELTAVIFCLRNPPAVASSMQTRYSLTISRGMSLWHTYSSRFLENTSGMPVFIFDYDRFCREPSATFSQLLTWLNRPVSEKTVQRHLNSFFIAPCSIPAFTTEYRGQVPRETDEMYTALQKASIQQIPASLPGTPTLELCTQP